MLTLLGAVCLALGVSFVCSFIEAALLSLTPADVARLGKEDARAGKIWQAFKSDIGRPISVILLLNTAAHTIGAAVAGAKFGDLYGDDHLWLFSLAFTFFMLQYTEILPKTLGVRYRAAFAQVGAVPLDIAVRVLNPVLRLIHFINRPFERGNADSDGKANPIDEITSLASMAKMSNLIGSRQEQIIFSATRLANITASQVMIPVEHVMLLSTTNSIQEAFLMAHVDLHTRYPVRDADDPKKFVGYVNFKELVYFMSTNPNNPSLAGIIRPLNFVSPDLNASELLKLFVDQHNHMVVVRDDNGECLGIVTVEDVVEELVGELEDEFDRLPQYVHSLAGGVWLAGGGTPMRQAARIIGNGFPEADGNISGWLTAELGAGFNRGDAVTKGRYEIAVRRIKRGRVFDAAIARK